MTSVQEQSNRWCSSQRSSFWHPPQTKRVILGRRSVGPPPGMWRVKPGSTSRRLCWLGVLSHRRNAPRKRCDRPPEESRRFGWMQARSAGDSGGGLAGRCGEPEPEEAEDMGIEEAVACLHYSSPVAQLLSCLLPYYYVPGVALASPMTHLREECRAISHSSANSAGESRRRGNPSTVTANTTHSLPDTVGFPQGPLV